MLRYNTRFVEFESFVNSDRCKAKSVITALRRKFESFVNSDRCKASSAMPGRWNKFESFVNSDRCKALLIRV